MEISTVRQESTDKLFQSEPKFLSPRLQEREKANRRRKRNWPFLLLLWCVIMHRKIGLWPILQPVVWFFRQWPQWNISNDQWNISDYNKKQALIAAIQQNIICKIIRYYRTIFACQNWCCSAMSLFLVAAAAAAVVIAIALVVAVACSLSTRAHKHMHIHKWRTIITHAQYVCLRCAVPCVCVCVLVCLCHFNSIYSSSCDFC